MVLVNVNHLPGAFWDYPLFGEGVLINFFFRS
jgi:lipid-A-disaccharide synthase-like uncharacterized protein